ncbi:hypothetical protein DERF_005983 [Dermatophagoides farinae]|uniref:Uncharacterized protein n=1 Tax=Dermatophagoides farinae TaxID=6954 RepID=A0A922I6J3_DERFA|nr:hypothetical protein DERF_005983 [Dermatophagoides farinae]
MLTCLKISISQILYYLFDLDQSIRMVVIRVPFFCGYYCCCSDNLRMNDCNIVIIIIVVDGIVFITII